jgi:hypothetical protein
MNNKTKQKVIKTIIIAIVALAMIGWLLSPLLR